MAVVPVSAFDEVPFFAHPLNPAHAISTLTFFVAGEWHMWFPVGGKLVKMDGTPHEADYFGDTAERATDQCFPIMNLIAQRTLTDAMRRDFHALWNDYQGLAASLSKLRLLYDNRSNQDYGIRRCVQQEIENLTVVARSTFDVLQMLVRAHIGLVPVTEETRPQQLPHSFRDVVGAGDRPRSADEIEERYVLPRLIAEWYARQAKFFLSLRSIRDRIVHRGQSIDLVFVTDRGFAVSRDSDPFEGLFAWPDAAELANGLVPLRPVAACIVSNTLDACDDFAATFSSCMTMPEPLAPGFDLYTRGTNDREFVALNPVMAGSLWDDA